MSLSRRFFEIGSRTDDRGTFLCLSKEKYPKEKTPHAALILRAEGFERGFSKGHPSPYEKRDASLHRPCGQNRSKPPVLGAASGGETPSQVWKWLDDLDLGKICGVLLTN